jgi:predicted nucleic acid-binding protein
MTIDSNIIIAYLAGDLEVKNTLSNWQLRGLPLLLSTVVETEVLSFPKFTPEEFNLL